MAKKLTSEQKEVLDGLTNAQIDNFQKTEKVPAVDRKGKDRSADFEDITKTGRRNRILSSVNDSSRHCWHCDQPIIELRESEVN